MTSNATKVNYLVFGWIFSIFLGVAVTLIAGAAVGIVTVLALTLAMVAIFVRIFRGEGEPLTPRPLWKLTAKPTSGFVVAAIFTVQAVPLLMTNWTIQTEPALTMISAILYLLVAVAFANSSLRIRSMTEDRHRSGMR
ncbi:hypothetical protein [Arthrobacter monumenti]